METLRKSNKMGIGRVVLRDRENVVLIAPFDSGLLLYKLRYPDEMRSMNQVPQIGDVKIDEAQLNLANTLVETMTKPFANLELKDRYREALMEIIDAKIAGKEVIARVEEDAPVVDIMAALQASISQAKSQMKPMKKATGEAKEEKQEEKIRKIS